MAASSDQAVFLTGNLFRHVTVMSLTSSFGLMAIFLVDFIDMLFISMLGKAELAAAVGYAGAILFLTTSISIGLAIAAGALVARALGAGDADRARQIGTHVIGFGFVAAVLFATTVWLNLETLSALIGASGETLDLSVNYLAIIVPSMPILMVGMTASAILRAHGDAKRAMWVTLSGGIVNAVLDPILIFGLDLELTGAAIASVAARFTITGIGCWAVIRYHGGFGPLKPGPFAKDLKAISALAFPAMATNLATPVGAAYVTRAMAEFGEDAVAGMALVGRITPVALAVIFALSGAIGPIIGQNFGAGNHSRVRGAFNAGLVFAGVYILGVAILLFLLREPLAALFNADGMMRTLLFLFCGPLVLFSFFNAVIFVGNAAFNNLGHPLYSTGVNWGRNTLGTVPFVMLGASLFGAPGVLIGQAAGGVLFGGLSWYLAHRLMAEAPKTAPRARPHFSRRARLMQIFDLRR